MKVLVVAGLMLFLLAQPAVSQVPKNNTSPVWSPDGQRIAFLSDRDGTGCRVMFGIRACSTEIYVMNADGSDQRRLTNSSEDEGALRWAPDSKRILFVSKGDIFVMNADGSQQLRLTSEGQDGSPDWSPDGQSIIFDSIRGGGVRHVYRMSADGTGQSRLTSGESGEDPAWSPDGQRIAFIGAGSRLYVMRLGSPLEVPISEAPVHVLTFEWAPDGKQTAVWSSEEVHTTVGGFGVTTIIDKIYVLSAEGVRIEQSQITREGSNLVPSWAPDGRRIVFVSNRMGPWQIYVMNSDGRDQIRLTEAGRNRAPMWAPDGKRIVFESNRDGTSQIYVMNADGRGQTRLTTP